MGILDEAIKEHLELKRRHGADEPELKKLEDEAFGAAERPGTGEPSSDALAEAPTEFMAQPELEAPEESPEAAAPASDEPPARGRTEIADLQEPPVESAAAAVDAPEEEPADEPSPAMEHEAIAEPAPPAEEPEPADEPEPESSAGPSTEERHAIAEHPTELYDVEAELGDAEPTDAEPEVRAVTEENLSEEDEEFWDEKRLSDELDQALEAPIELQEPEVAEAPEAVDEPESVEEQNEVDEPESPQADERPVEPPGNQDVLDQTPDFLEEKPEDAELWFEQRPPKDFDFDD